MHPAGLALEVFSLSLMGVDLPGCTTSAAQGNIVIHAIILAFVIFVEDSGMVALKGEPSFVCHAMPVFGYVHNHL